jgi:fimbrial chaperone protein
MKNKVDLARICGALVIFCLSPAFAFRFSPIYATLTPDGKGKTASFSIENNQKVKVAVQISIFRREEAIDGTETNPSAKELFSIFPEQLLLEPGQTRSVRVSWLGKEPALQEIPFRLMAQQLDVQGISKPTDPKTAEIKVLMAYKASLYIEPPNVSPDVVVEDAEVIKVDKAGAKLKMTLHNRGKKHQLLIEPALKIAFKDQTDKDVNVQIEGKDLENMNEENVLPGNKRAYEIPWKHPMPKGPIQVAIKIKSEE